MLHSFLAKARERGWTERVRLRPPLRTQRSNIRLTASVAEAGKVLVDILKPGEQSLTAVKMEDGELHVTESADKATLAGLVEGGAQDKKKKKPKKAASVTRPTPCCPSCIPGSVERASEVLLTFLTDEQHEQWAEHRHIDVVGHLSGHRYRIAHRHSELAQQWGKICADLTDGGILHFHDWSVPPEEEVLATKLIMEHREPWLRNQATCCGSDIFQNPFGDAGDGVVDAVFTAEVGSFVLGMVGRTSP